MNPDFEIITPRLKLSLITNDRARELQQLVCQSPSLHQWLDWCHGDFTLKQAGEFIQATRLNWIRMEAFGFGVYQRDSAALIGMVAVNELYQTFNMASIGYWVGDQYQRQGLASEAVAALAELCFAKLGLTRLEVVCDPQNIASQALIEALGAKKEALARHRFIYRGQPKDGLVYSLLPSDIE
ncbi:GNAT family protein [Vibrio sp. CAU 1672]|uniref:GNAT family N-acetyltransferase n=1 Tax=Vibrio sp. CAU 1672 TaxID=3032594 RepID=UPI0023DB28D3|nr:GNAT family protein [Vibrio sp. CAU 1672]MDF2153622.1 GNAT family protein [Vibrio sp. CAU 1672]